MQPESINLNDTNAVMEQLSKMSVEKAEAAIQATLEQYTCELVFDQSYRNGQMIQGAFRCVFIKGKEVELGKSDGN